VSHEPFSPGIKLFKQLFYCGDNSKAYAIECEIDKGNVKGNFNAKKQELKTARMQAPQ
jgi:hypothetical protein